jgi:hypothetical protein
MPVLPARSSGGDYARHPTTTKVLLNMHKIIRFLTIVIYIIIYVFMSACSSSSIRKDNTGVYIYNMGRASEYDVKPKGLAPFDI